MGITAAEIAQATRSFDPTEARARRQALGLPRRVLAHEAGVTETTLLRWELGHSRPRGEVLVRYLHLLDELEAVSS